MEQDATYPPTVEEVFGDFKGRREGLIKALTTEFEDFYLQCDPEKENMILYALPNGQWKVEVDLDADLDPYRTLPEPTLGINFSKDGMGKKEWLILVAVHSEAWLLSFAYSIAVVFDFDKSARERLFDMINELPSVTEVVWENQEKGESCVNNNNSSNEPHPASQEDMSLPQGEQDDDKCGKCLSDKEFRESRISCDTCKKWFHRECVDVTNEQSKLIKKYECTLCRRRRKGKSHIH